MIFTGTLHSRTADAMSRHFELNTQTSENTAYFHNITETNLNQ
jgi:hypothetical protein